MSGVRIVFWYQFCSLLTRGHWYPFPRALMLVLNKREASLEAAVLRADFRIDSFL